jgi:hypothetical protein
MSRIVQCLDHDVVVSGPVVRVARLEQEWYEDLENPTQMIAALTQGRPRADILSFWQRLPDVDPKYDYYHEPEYVAAMPISTYDEWFNKHISSRTRGMIRKTSKQGVEVREVAWTDEFVQGVTRIFNESPMRQGRRFWHYGKTFETVKREFSRYLYRELLLGAYVGEELVGFMMIGLAGKYAVTGQIISMLKHRDKAPTNVLVAKAVEVCAREKIPYLVYLHWGTGSLSEFKRRIGFERIALPRYYVPLTARGRMALKLGLHNGIVPLLPDPTVVRLKRLRDAWYRGLYSLRDRKALAGDGD